MPADLHGFYLGASDERRQAGDEKKQDLMSVVKSILMRAFGRPQGTLGKIGGCIMARMNQKMGGLAIDLLDVQPSNKVLEVGFGPGVGIELLAKSALSGHVVGIDPSEEMV